MAGRGRGNVGGRLYSVDMPLARTTAPSVRRVRLPGVSGFLSFLLSFPLLLSSGYPWTQTSVSFHMRLVAVSRAYGYEYIVSCFVRGTAKYIGLVLFGRGMMDLVVNIFVVIFCDGLCCVGKVTKVIRGVEEGTVDTNGVEIRHVYIFVSDQRIGG